MHTHLLDPGPLRCARQIRTVGLAAKTYASDSKGSNVKDACGQFVTNDALRMLATRLLNSPRSSGYESASEDVGNVMKTTFTPDLGSPRQGGTAGLAAATGAGRTGLPPLPLGATLRLAKRATRHAALLRRLTLPLENLGVGRSFRQAGERSTASASANVMGSLCARRGGRLPQPGTGYALRPTRAERRASRSRPLSRRARSFRVTLINADGTQVTGGAAGAEMTVGDGATHRSAADSGSRRTPSLCRKAGKSGGWAHANLEPKSG